MTNRVDSRKNNDGRPSTAPPRLTDRVAPPVAPPPETARPSTGKLLGLKSAPLKALRGLNRLVSTSESSTGKALKALIGLEKSLGGMHAWQRVYARTVRKPNAEAKPLKPCACIRRDHKIY